MAPLNLQVTKKLDNGYVQAEILMPKGRSSIKFKVPEQSADDFCKELKNNDKAARTKKNLFDFVMTPAIIISSYILANRSLNLGNGIKFLACTLPALLIDYACNSKLVKNYTKKNDLVIKKYNATEIEENDIFEKTLK